MKQHTLWCLLNNGKYVSKRGCIFEGGIFGAYRWLDNKNEADYDGWVNHHIPTGLSTFENSPSLKEAREGAQRLMSIIDIIDWYETDAYILSAPMKKIMEPTRKLFVGEYTREEFVVKVMEDKLSGN